jgi:hypothetical protein
MHIDFSFYTENSLMDKIFSHITTSFTIMIHECMGLSHSWQHVSRRRERKMGWEEN